MFSWSIFKNYLFSRRSGALVKIIAWHCILGIGMGVAALIIVLSVMNGFNLTIRSKMLSVEPHLVVQEKNPTQERRELLEIDLRSFAREGVDQVNTYEAQDLIIRSVEGIFGGAVAKGYDTPALKALLARVAATAKGEVPLSEDLFDLGENELILGLDLGRSLGVFEGDEVVLVPPETLLLPKGEIPKFQKYRVKTLISTQMPEVDSKLLFYNSEALTRLKSASLESGFEVRLHNPYEAARLKEQLVSKGYAQVQTWGERDTSLFFALKMESFAMSLFLSLAVLITSFSIVIVMVLLMSQKRQDIGMFMALGLSLRATRRVFLNVGLLMSFLGIAGGCLLGIGVSLFLDWYPLELLPDIYTDSTLPAKLSWKTLIYVFSGTCVIAVIGSWLPVWRYVLSNPSENLRKPGAAKG